jgi:hypothetical protein
VFRQCITPLNPSLEYTAVFNTIKTFIQEYPGIAALLIFAILVIDTLYVYRVVKKAWKKSSRNPAGAQSSHNKLEGSE